MSAQRPMPHPTAWSRAFWEAASRRQLVIQECRACKKLIMYPKRVCPACLGEDLGWREASGRGEVYTVTVQMAGPPSGFEDRLPYVLAVIRLEEGVQMMSNLVGPGSMEARCGDPVVADFETAGEVTLPVFRLAAAKAGGSAR
ncbi:MAG: Zn-ribbon domain-containing OB-fold protein [Roseiarcus sp.]